MSNLIDLAREVERAREALDRAIERLRSATGLSVSRPQTRPQRVVAAGPRPNGASVSQRVLDAILKAPDGLSRAELKGFGSEGAIHSALKQHKAHGFIDSVDGKWRGAGAPALPTPKKKGPRP